MMAGEKKRRVLFLTPYLPRPASLHAGGGASAFYLQCLLERFEVDLVCLGTARDRREARDIWPGIGHLECINYRQDLRERVEGAFEDAVRPDRWGKGARFRFREAVRARVARSHYDVLQVEHQETDLWMGDVAVPVRRIDLHDVVSGLLEKGSTANPSPEDLADLEAARRHESELLRRYHRVSVRSLKERDRLANPGGPARLEILRHPVPVPPSRVARDRRIAGRILMTGSFHRPANQAAARELVEDILPRVLKKCPDASILILGDGAEEHLADLGGGKPVEVKGRVPDLVPAYEESMVFVNPLRCGGGVISRHLESLVNGLPVVTVPAGAEGLDALRGFAASETAGDLAAVTIRLLTDSAHWESCSRSGRETVREIHDPDKVRTTFHGLYDRSIEAGSHD